MRPSPRICVYIYTPVKCWNFFAVNLDFHKGFFGLGELLRECFPGSSRLHPSTRAGAGFWVTAESTARTGVYILPSSRVGKISGFPWYIAVIHCSLKSTFVHVWAPNCGDCVRLQRKDPLTSPVAQIPLKHQPLLSCFTILQSKPSAAASQHPQHSREKRRRESKTLTSRNTSQ